MRRSKKVVDEKLSKIIEMLNNAEMKKDVFNAVKAYVQYGGSDCMDAADETWFDYESLDKHRKQALMRIALN